MSYVAATLDRLRDVNRLVAIPDAAVRWAQTPSPKPAARNLKPQASAPQPNGKLITMTVTMDSAGRLVIPKKIRDEAEIEPGMPLDLEVHNGEITIKPQAGGVTLVRKGRWLVAQRNRPGPPLTNEDVNRIIDKIRNERGR